MKKLFTLVASIMMAMSSMATETILLEKFSLPDWSQGSPTFTSADAKVGDFIKITIEEGPAGSQMLLANSSWDDVLPGGISPANNKVIYYQITEDILPYIKGDGLMLKGNGGVVGQVSLLPSEDLDKVAAYEGSGQITASWGSVTVSKANFNFVKEGDIVVVNTTNESKVPGKENFLFKKNGYDDAASIYTLISPWCISLTDELASGYFGSEDNHFQAEQPVITINSVDIYRLKTKVSSNQVVLADTPTPLDNYSGSVVIPADKFAEAQVGDEVRVSLTDVDNSTSYNAQLKMATNSDGWPMLTDKIGILNVPNVPVFVYVIPDDATLSTLKATGLIFQGKGATISSVSLYTSVTSSISQITSETKQANIPVYNLAGQQVGASYKGIVVKNGKKFVQK